MAQQTINVGTIANDGTGDTIRAAMVKVNSNFTEVYGNLATLQSGASISITDLKTLVAASTDFADFQSRIAAL